MAGAVFTIRSVHSYSVRIFANLLPLLSCNFRSRTTDLDPIMVWFPSSDLPCHLYVLCGLSSHHG